MTVPRRPHDATEAVPFTRFSHVRWNVPPEIGPRLLDFFVVCNYVAMKEYYPHGGAPPVMFGRN
jgi:hypothetical protein